METKDIILELHKKRGLSQDELDTKVMVTRQAVSRWENGETIPNMETLKLLSKEFNVDVYKRQALIPAKSPANCAAHLAESIFQTGFRF